MNCKDKCCICSAEKACVVCTSEYHDMWAPARASQVIDRLNHHYYPYDEQYMIQWLKDTYGIDYMPGMPANPTNESKKTSAKPVPPKAKDYVPIALRPENVVKPNSDTYIVIKDKEGKEHKYKFYQVIDALLTLLQDIPEVDE